MDITPIYELRGRLRAAAIAGTNLVGEDFRLRRAAEAMAPLEKASPVFSKIGQLTRNLLEGPAEERAGTLLDAIALVDAVLCTQAAVGVTMDFDEVTCRDAGQAETLQTEGGAAIGQERKPKLVVNAPYSVVHRLQDALTNSGGGRYGFLMETYKSDPALFQDYRVKPKLVAALGAGYSELADQAVQWLKKDGPELMPLLEDGFDPKGKKEMVRRVQVMEAVGGPEAREFFLKVLPDAEKDVKLALIYGLRRWPENMEFLTELTKTEKGKAKRQAYLALASMETAPSAVSSAVSAASSTAAGEETARRLRAFWEQYMEKKPEEGLEYLSLSDTALAASLFTDGMRNRWAACGDDDGLRTKLRGLILQALWINQEEAVCRLAEEIYEEAQTEEEKKAMFTAAVTARLLTEEDCSEWLDRQMTKKNLLASRLNKELLPALAFAFSGLTWDGEKRQYMFYRNLTSPIDGQVRWYVMPMKQQFTGRFMRMLDFYRGHSRELNWTLQRVQREKERWNASCQQL